MSASDSGSNWYVVGAGTDEYPKENHTSGSFASSVFFGKKRVLLDGISLVKQGAVGGTLEVIDSAGVATGMTFTVIATGSLPRVLTPPSPNGIEMGAGFGLRAPVAADWVFLCTFRVVS